jgi:hypothetical protein
LLHAAALETPIGNAEKRIRQSHVGSNRRQHERAPCSAWIPLSPAVGGRLPVLVSDAMGCGPTQTHQPTQPYGKTGSGDRSSSTPCFFL